MHFTAAEQLAGYRLLQDRRPDLCKRDADDSDLLEAWIDACEDAICLDLVEETL